MLHKPPINLQQNQLTSHDKSIKTNNDFISSDLEKSFPHSTTIFVSMSKIIYLYIDFINRLTLL